MMRLAALAFVLAACGDSYVVVTVDAQPGVVGATQLAVVVTDNGATTNDTLQLGTHEFPTTFSLTTSGRSGSIDVGLEALGSDGTLLALGSGSTTAGDNVAIMLEPADFLVNTDTTSDNFLSTDYEAKGFQVGATVGGPWTVSFRNDCTNDCQIFARMFDQTGQPLKTEVASSTNEFTLTTTATDDETFPAVAAANAARDATPATAVGTLTVIAS